MDLILTRPLAILDTETTGLNPRTDRIVQVGAVKLYPDGESKMWSSLVNPGVPIPPDATAVHGITDAMVEGAPSFRAVALSLARALKGCDLAGFNVRGYDEPILRAEFDRAGVPWPCDDAKIVDAMDIFKKRETRDLSAAVRFYCDREHTDAHGALPDALAARDVLLGELARYPDLPRDVEGLSKIGYHDDSWATKDGKVRWNSEGVAVIAFGNENGTPLHEVDRKFLRWVLSKDFPEDVKAMVKRAYRGEVVRRGS